MMHEFINPVLDNALVQHVSNIISYLKKKNKIIRGRKACQKAIKKGGKGILLLPQNISPFDLISHLPVLCEDNNIKYCYVDNQIIKRASTSGTMSCCVFIKKKKSYLNDFEVINGKLLSTMQFK